MPRKKSPTFDVINHAGKVLDKGLSRKEAQDEADKHRRAPEGDHTVRAVPHSEVEARKRR